MRFTVKYLSLLLLSYSIVSCAVPPKKNTAWTSQQYVNHCSSGVTPEEPYCLTFAKVGNGFKYPRQANSCIQSVENYVVALDRHYGCVNRKLKPVFDDLIENSLKVVQCYNYEFSKTESFESLHRCQKVTVPNFYQSYEVDGLEARFGLPGCVTEIKGFDFTPKNKFSLKQCKNDVMTFAGKNLSFTSYGVHSAQKQYDEYMHNLEELLNRKSKQVMDKLECIIKDNKFCYSTYY